VRGRCLARRGDRFRVVGTLNPFVARQSFVVSFHCGRRVRNFAVVTRRFRRSPKGGFVVRYRPRRSGWITIRASHRRSRLWTR
jgi:hypothetical protein